MGNFCATDPYKQIKETYPRDFEKHVIGEEMKKTLKAKMESAKTNINASIVQIKQQNIKTIDRKEKQTSDHYESIKGQVERYYLGGIKGLQQANNAEIDQIFAYKTIKQKYQQLRQETNEKFATEQLNVQKQLVALSNEQYQKINKEQPKVELFDQLADKLKHQVYISGLKEYKDKIDHQANVYLAPLDKKIAKENFAQRFKMLLPIDDLKSLTQQSNESLDKQLGLIIGNPSQMHAVLG